MNVSKLSSWIRRRPGDATILQLVWLSQAEGEEPVDIWQLAELKDHSPDSIAELVLDSAQNDCDEREYSSRYQLRACTEDKVLSGFVIKCQPEGDEARDPLDIGKAAANSTNAQLVRTVEVLLRSHVQSYALLVNGYKHLLENQQDEIKSLRRREQAAADVIQTAANIAMGQEADASVHGEALAKFAEFVEKYGPPIVDRIVNSPTNGTSKGMPSV